MKILEPKLLILASAGSGKTYQLSNRIIGLIAKGVDPERIVALTFTRKAAAEFADSVLTKLAKAATHPEAAQQLEKELGLQDVDFVDVLCRVSRSLHRITLGTMDSFFARVVKAFQYELGLTGGRFDLIEGPRQEIATDSILQHILGDVFGSSEGSEFSHAFRRASIGREQQGVARNLREFIKHWHLRYRHHPDHEWGPPALVKRKPEDWEKCKRALGKEVIDQVGELKDGHRKALKESIGEILDHTIASGSLGDKIGSLTKCILEAVSSQSGDNLTLKYRTEFEITGPSATALRKLVRLAAQCELAAAAERSRALHEVIMVYDQQCERLLRTRGQLGFDDVKLLMGQWAQNEEARLRREAIDFRLDARIDHWLLDEFQDTSAAEWNGLLPLVDEAASDDQERSLFIVGDRKQAIYAWRGGDVSLFDKVISHYSPALKVEALDESWRSCPEVLAMVNQICGERGAAEAVFGEAAQHWDCPLHESAKPLCDPQKRGHSRIEMVTGWDDKFDRMEEILRQLGVGERELTCGVLLRGNEAASKVAAELRARGFDVILEGKREPGKDSLIGVAISQLLRWLADPGNQLARGVVAMSPLHAALIEAHGKPWNAIWSGLSAAIAMDGYRASVAAVIAECTLDWSAYSQRRIQDILQALGDIDRRGHTTHREVAETIGRLSIAQSPGVAAIQVMTIHKSKGLGFDVVLLPEIPSKVAAEAQHFRVMEGENWLSEAPPQWVRKLNPQLDELEHAWGLRQQHEAMCTLYVALTRAKRGLYVLLDPPSASHDFDKASLANWMMRATGLDSGDDQAIYEHGSFDWSHDVPVITEPPARPAIPALQGATANSPVHASPSSLASHEKHSASGMAFGSEVHSLLEGVGWADEASPTLPDTAAGEAVRKLMESDACRGFFIKGGRDIRLLREQAVDAEIEGRWISGVIDRLHLHRDGDGSIRRVEIIDFKTDAAESAETLRAAYSQQLVAYRQCLQKIYPKAEVECLLLSTHLREAVAL